MITEERLRGLWRQYHPKPIILSEWELALYRAVEREARREALEEAAKVCEGLFSGDDCAAEIRALTKKEEIEK